MEIKSAIELVEDLIYKPGWEITATDHSRRFEGTITVKIVYPARKSERAEADKDYPTEITTYATFPMVVKDCNDEDLYRQILNAIIDIETHEAREFLRVHPTNWAPFHPHRVDGMKRYGTMNHDLKFGIA